MKLKVYSLRDSIACEHMMLFTAPSDPMLKRNLKKLMLGGLPLLCENPQDLTVVEIGEWDTNTGLLTGLPEPIHTFHILEIKNECDEEVKKYVGRENTKTES